LRQLFEPATKKPIRISRSFNVPDLNDPFCQFHVWSSGKSGKILDASGSWIEKPGEYFFDLQVDGKNTGRLPIHILLAGSH
jgi:hypothetical protein